MGRFFAAVLLGVMLLPAPRGYMGTAEPAFFSLMFPQLIPGSLLRDSMQGLAGEEALL